MTFLSACLLLLAMVMEVAREICFKLAANGKSDHDRYLLRVIGTPMTWAGITCWGIELVAWIRVLSDVPLSIAFPLMSLCYCGMVLAGKLVFKEPVDRKKMLGILLITVGVAIIGSQGMG